VTRRDRAASSLTCAEVLADERPAGPVLLAGGHVEPMAAELADLGTASVVWRRQAFAGAQATAWPPEGPFPTVALRLPKGKDAIRMMVVVAARRLGEGGVLFLHGANDEGIKSAGKVLSTWFDDVHSARSKRHARVWRASSLRRRPPPPEPTEVEATVNGVALRWQSWPGLFAHGRLDAATEALLRHLPAVEGRILDFGCGAGVISQFVQRRDGVLAEGVDVDALALEAFRANVPGATAHLADALPSGTGRYRYIVSNPPLHRGKDRTPGPMRALIDAAPKRLARSGELWITTQGAMSLRGHLQDKFPVVDRVWRDRRFAVWRAAR